MLALTKCKRDHIHLPRCKATTHLATLYQSKTSILHITLPEFHSVKNKFVMPPSPHPFRTDRNSMDHQGLNIHPHPDTVVYDSCLGSVELCRPPLLLWLLQLLSLLPLPLPGRSSQLDSAYRLRTCQSNVL